MKTKKILSFVLAAVMMFSLATTSFAVEITTDGNSQNVTVSYGMSEGFTVTIPGDFTISTDTNKGTAIVSASNVMIGYGEVLEVSVSGDDYTTGWELIDQAEVTNKLAYTIGTSDGASDITNNSVVLDVEAGEAPTSTVSETMYFTVTDALTKSGTYKDTLTFTVGVTGGTNGGGNSTLYAANFADNSWDEIAEAVQNKAVPSTWSVGDAKEMEIEGESYTVAIIGKNHDTYADGSGTVPLTFQVVDLVNTYNMNSTDTNSGSWDGSDMYSYLNNTLINSLPAEVSSNIKAVTKHTNLGGADTGDYATTTETSSDKLFLLADAEITGDDFWTWYDNEFIPWMIENEMAEASDEEKIIMAQMYANFCNVMKAEGNQYAYYAATGSIATAPTVEELMDSWDMNYWYSMDAATLSGLDGVAASWWLRSPDPSNSICFIYVGSTGDDSFDVASSSLGVAFGFCF